MTTDMQFAQMNGRIDSIEKEMEEMGKKLSDNIDGLGETFRREVKAQSSFRGTYAQRATLSGSIHIARPFANLHNLKRIKVRQVIRRDLVAMLEDNMEAVEQLGLRDRSWDTFQAPDVIAEVRELGTPDDHAPAFYVAAEASYTIEEEDLTKATDHARILQAVTGLRAYPAVSGVELDDEMSDEAKGRLYDSAEQIEANGSDAVLLYYLESADLKPPEPR